jgi:H2-forming N5,N10-methylenetetrahydromethanopterin dehydrogenase-like enzyme
MLDYHLNATLHTPSKLPQNSPHPCPKRKAKTQAWVALVCSRSTHRSKQKANRKQTERKQNATESDGKKKKVSPKELPSERKYAKI